MKKLILKLSVLATTLLSILMFSCYGEYSPNSNNSLLSFEDYLNITSKFKAKGSVLLQSNNFLTTQNNPVNTCVSLKGNTKIIKFYNESNEFDIVNNSFQENNELFGRTLKYNNGIEVKSMYIPKLLNVSINSKILDTNTKITWNADSSNKKGVIIWITYKPTNQYLGIANNNRNYITEGFVVEDFGEYKFKASDLERFPKESLVDINVVRGSFDIQEGETPSLMSYTSISYDIKIGK